ncbi:MAG: DUF488 domain-containing protein [Alphaproteobacteria bacterium]|nr:MAG: DUF488 domain-containing protein [Alphaproteobacteria bacterium]
MKHQVLFTIGYEGATATDFWATLRIAGIRNLIDIRDVPVSRKPGFSKKALSESATSHGVSYFHLAALGDPKEGRDAAKRGNHQLFREIFTAHMETMTARQDLSKAIELTGEAPSCLLCYERDPLVCHRSIVAACIVRRNEFRLFHLGVHAELSLQSPSTQRRHESRDFAAGKN